MMIIIIIIIIIIANHRFLWQILRTINSACHRHHEDATFDSCQRLQANVLQLGDTTAIHPALLLRASRRNPWQFYSNLSNSSLL